jgi:surface polysaccharide O-acyltransferase-like enzyme
MPAPKKTYPNLDLAKFLCALLVIVIHTAPMVNHTIAHIYISDVLCRVSVPLFFGISGFLLFGQMVWENGKIQDCAHNRSRLWRYWKHTVVLYLFWSIVYLAILIPQWYTTGWWGWAAVKDALFSLLFVGPFYHLWYLLSLIWSIPLIYCILCKIPFSAARIFAAGLWILRCLSTGYSWIWGVDLAVLDLIANKFGIVVGAVFSTLPIMTMGVSVAVDLDQSKRSPKLLPVVFWLGMWVLEATGLLFLSPSKSVDTNLFSVLFFVYFTLDYLIHGQQIRIPTNLLTMLRNANLLIYCLHPLIIHFLKQRGLTDGPALWVIVTAAVLCISFIWSYWKIYGSKRTDHH